MFTKVLVANRGAIALRILRTLRRMGIGSVARVLGGGRGRAARRRRRRGGRDRRRRAPRTATSTPTRSSRPPTAPAPRPSTRATASSPRTPTSRRAARQLGIAFVGPTAEQIRAFGLKHTARALATEAPACRCSRDRPAAARWRGAQGGRQDRLPGDAEEHRGRRRHRHAPLRERRRARRRRSTSVARLARAHFKDAGVYLEKLVDPARHVEVQIFGDGAGRVLALGQRDCSLQRRNQKVVEETPPPGLSRPRRAPRWTTRPCASGRPSRYRSAGTVEFVVDARDGAFYFLEVNTRIQVEHGVTEEVTGLDIVEWMIRVAAGEPPPAEAAPASAAPRSRPGSTPRIRRADFQPSAGVLTEVVFPDGRARRGRRRSRQRGDAVTTIRCSPR